MTARRERLACGRWVLFLALGVHTRPYWRLVTVLTPAIVLMASKAADGLSVDERRLAWTLAAAAFAVAVTLVVNGVLAFRARHRSPPDPA